MLSTKIWSSFSHKFIASSSFVNTFYLIFAVVRSAAAIAVLAVSSVPASNSIRTAVASGIKTSALSSFHCHSSTRSSTIKDLLRTRSITNQFFYFDRSFCSATTIVNNNKMVFNYPSTRRDEEFVEELHGVKVADPYRWLEDLDSKETNKFINEQNKITNEFIGQCEVRSKISNRLTELWNYPRYGAPFKRGDNYFFYMNSGLQNQSVLYILNSLDAEPRVFFDPNTLSEDGTSALSATSFSEDGKSFAYGISESGSDWIKIRIRSVETGQDLDEVLNYCKFTSISFTHDHKGFFYSRYAEKHDMALESDENQQLFYHRLNTPQSDDVLVVQFPEHPKYRMTGGVSDCGRYLNVIVSETCDENLWYYVDLQDYPEINGEFTIKPLVESFEAEYEYITNDENLFYFRTNKNSPNFRVARLDIHNPSSENWVNIIPEHEKDVLDSAHCVDGDKLVVIYIRDVINVIEIRHLQSGDFIRKLDIPIGTLVSFSGLRKHSEIFFHLTSFLTPGIVYHYDFNKHEVPQVFREIKLKNFDASIFETKQVFYTSKDGQTKVPMFIVHRKDLELDGDAPCLLYGYGGFKISIQPYFSVNRLVLMGNLKGVYAVANIRGGGEYGQNWHDGGKMFNKQNVFDDFQAAGEYLIENGYTNPKKLVIEGGSNGGLLVGACANQRPDLFGGAIAHVGVMDMLRFHKFTIGHAWVSDYGDPDDEKHFKNLLKFSPYHNVPKDVEQFPATLLLTADHDNRVVPIHSLKYIAELQHSLGSKLPDTPLLIRIDCKSGHGAGKPITKSIEELTDIYCFLIQSLGFKFEDL